MKNNLIINYKTKRQKIAIFSLLLGIMVLSLTIFDFTSVHAKYTSGMFDGASSVEECEEINRECIKGANGEGERVVCQTKNDDCKKNIASNNNSNGPPATTIIPDKYASIMGLLKLTVSILTGLVGILAVVMTVMAGVIYATAGESAEKVQKAKTMITQIVIGLVLYAFAVAFINFLVPGGVF